MNDNFQYGDIIFLGIIAIFVILRLRSMLGQDKGIDPRDLWKNATNAVSQEKVVQFPGIIIKKEPPEDEIAKEFAANPVIAEGLKAIKSADNSFNFKDFLGGAKVAFEWVLESYSKGDKEKLKMVLSEERFKHFSEDLDQKAGQEQKHETTLIAINESDITEAGMRGNVAFISVQFTTEQVNVVRDKDNNVIEGSVSEIEKAVDIFTFERDVTSRDPNWKITAT